MPSRALAALAIATAVCTAEDRQATFTATTRLVEFTVVALDRKGAPVTNLSKDQFTVLDNGKPRSIAFFRYEGLRDTSQPKTPAVLPAGTFANRYDMGASPTRNATVLVMDGLNTDPNDQAVAKAQMLRFLQTFAPHTRIAIVQFGPGLRVIHDFTDDMTALRAALDKAPAPFSGNRSSDIQAMAAAADELMEQAEARKMYSHAPQLLQVLTSQVVGELSHEGNVQRSRLNATLGMLESLGRHMSGIPGRKSLVWISSGVSTSTVSAIPVDTPHAAPARINPAAGASFDRAVRAAGQRLAAIGVTLYAVDARGLTSSAERLSEMQYPPNIGGRFSEAVTAAEWTQDTRAAFSILTSITGGRYFFNTNDLAAPVKQAGSDIQGCYSIGYYVPEEPDGKWHELKVAAAVPGVDIHHQSGWLAASRDRQAADRKMAEKLLLDPLGASAIGITARATPAVTGQGAVELFLQIKTEDLAFSPDQDRRRGEIAIVIGDIGPKGNVAFHEETIRLNFTPEQYQAALRGNIPYRRTYTPPPNTVAIRALVRDNSVEHFGTVDVPFAAVYPK